jgi:hypothetical protein
MQSKPIADDDYWRDVSGWWRIDGEVNVDRFAELLAVSPAAIRQYRSREAGFPAPTTRAGRARWVSADVYQWIEVTRPKRRSMIPRLFHPGDNLQPAVFIASETHVIPRETLATADDAPASTTWVVHLWQPADARGQVAIAYGEHHTSESEERAAELLSRLPHVSAVAVVTDALCHFASADVVEYSFQPEIAVAEPHLGTYRRGWFALAALLRVDLPWWPAGLRRIDDMAAWRPGARPQAIPPFIPGLYDDFMLRNLIKESAPPQSTQCEVLVDSLNRRIEGEIYRTSATVPDVPGHVERPGLKQAARPYYSITNTPEPLKPFEAQALLRLSGATHATRSAAVRLLRGRPEMEPAVSYTIRARAADGPLAAEWFSRLEPCDDPESLGSTFAEMMMSDVQRAAPRTWWVDPADTNCWIVETLDGIYHATVACRSGSAHGRLTEFELAESQQAAFFRADGRVWPMPVPAFGSYYTSGYEGRGPAELIRTVALLRISADIDLSETHPSMVPPPALVRYVESHEAPLSVLAGELPGFG